ncbi:MAG: FAD-dependent oxidoreductase, partial [Phycisphaerae bacterium]|nr:FAD-dependent oxidoreductase [Phycisphaerae bacterium]
VAAARLGAKVALIESNGFFGGVATASLVNIWHSLADLKRKNQIIGGLTSEVIDRLRRKDAIAGRYALNTEMLKLELDDMVTKAGIRPFLHALFVAPIVAGGRMTAAVIEDKSGRRAIRAKQFIDASGDADVISRMGLEVYARKHVQPPTMCCVLRGMREIRKKHRGFNVCRAIFDKKYPQALKKGFAWLAGVPGATDHLMLAGTRVFGANCADADQLTRAELEGRRQVSAICDLLREHFMDAKGVPLAWLPAKIGIRETRHARCIHTLTVDEILSGKRFKDAIGNGTYPVDVHSATGAGVKFRHLKGVPFYQIPFSSLVPRGAKNVLVAGRCLDADEGAFGAVRVMVNCNQMGQAAGAASWLALDSSKDVDKLDVAKLRTTLKKQGAVVI